MKQGFSLFPLWAATAALLLILAVACQPSGAVEGTPLPSSTAASPLQETGTATMPTSPSIPTPISAGLQQLVAQAKEDLSLRLSIPTTQIDLVQLGAVVWPDGALGCPQPGVVYAQVQQEGLLIRLRAGKRIYPYHSGGGTPPFLCEQAITDDTP